MKYELKRPTKKYVAIYGGFVIFGLIGIFSGESFICIIFTLLSSGFLINEFIRSKDAEFTFDENSFYIGNTRYKYTDIERIRSRWQKNMSSVRIVVDGCTVYRFDTNYKGTKDFVRMLTLNGIDHNLFK